MVMICAYFWPSHSPFSNYQCSESDIAAIGTIFNVFSFDDSMNLVKVSDSDYDVKKLANERPVYTVIDQW